MAWTVSTVTPRHKQIMRMQACGMTQAQIAEELNMSRAGVGVIVRSPLYKQAYQALENQVKDRFVEKLAEQPIPKRLHDLAPRALDVMEGGLMSENNDMRFRSAKDILDRAGHTAPSKSVVMTVSLDGQFQEDVRRALADVRTIDATTDGDRESP